MNPSLSSTGAAVSDASVSGCRSPPSGEERQRIAQVSAAWCCRLWVGCTGRLYFYSQQHGTEKRQRVDHNAGEKHNNLCDFVLLTLDIPVCWGKLRNRRISDASWWDSALSAPVLCKKGNINETAQPFLQTITENDINSASTACMWRSGDNTTDLLCPGRKNKRGGKRAACSFSTLHKSVRKSWL